MRSRRRRVMLKAASDICCRSVVGAVMKAAAPGAPRDCHSVLCLGRRVASKVHLRNSCFGFRSAAKLLLPSASCSQSNA
eukprot:6622819-Prorocentrum_lima.AAC.1